MDYLIALRDLLNDLSGPVQTGAAVWLAIRLEGIIKRLTRRVDVIENRLGPEQNGPK